MQVLFYWSYLFQADPVVINFDGKNGSDIFVRGLVYVNNGSKLEFCSTCGPNLGQDGRYYFGDFDGDKLTDVLFQKNSGGWVIYRSTGSGFSKLMEGSWPSYGDKITVGDFNGDGRDDLFMQSIGSGWGGYQVWLNSRALVRDGFLYRYVYKFIHGWSGNWPSWADNVVAGKFTNDSVSDILVTADRGAGATWSGWNLRKVSGKAFVEAGKGAWPSWGDRISVGKVLPEDREQILVNANFPTSSWEGFKLMSWDGSMFVEKYWAKFPSHQEKVLIGDFKNNGIGCLFVAPTAQGSGLNHPANQWVTYSFPITN